MFTTLLFFLLVITASIASSSLPSSSNRVLKSVDKIPNQQRAKSNRNPTAINPSEISRVRERNLLSNMERDNLFEDPAANHKKLPDFGLNEPKLKIVGRASKRALLSTDAKYRKNFEARRLDFINKERFDGYLYDLVTAPSAVSSLTLCETCWQLSTFKCSICMAPLCQKACLDTHKENRCNKFVR